MDKRKRGKKTLKGKSTLSEETIRQICDCEATKHPLVNNCLNCGRIICSIEGSGPCFYCSYIVTYNNEPSPLCNLTQDSENKQKRSFENKNNLVVHSNDTLKLRDKLLEFDKNCASRTTVIDDECDYFQANNTWLNKKEREQRKELEANVYEEKHKSRLSQKLSVDFTGRIHKETKDPLELFNKMNSIQDDRNFSASNPYNDHVISIKRPLYVDDGNSSTNAIKTNNIGYNSNRIQDKGYLEILDPGLCLSLHQPYASLLVRGIKTTEGRTWYSSHRGRLWIASAAKEPSKEEILNVEKMYQDLNNEPIEFPKVYPTGCLIGCVSVTDVLSQEEYDKFYPNNKIDSPYIFICENFFELPIKYPIQGKHKIYKLDSVIHRAALNCLEKTCYQMSKNQLIS